MGPLKVCARAADTRAMDLYLLIHPEAYVESLDLFRGPGAGQEYITDSEYTSELDFAQRQWAKDIAEQAAGAKARAAVLYDELELHETHLPPGVSRDGWEWTEADGATVVPAALQLAAEALVALGRTDAAGATCTIAGTHREDCVARVAAALTEAGWSVELHEEAVLPPY